jgi:hypothetical protein
VSRRKRLLLAIVLAAQLAIQVGIYHVLSASSTAEPDSLVPYAGIIRRDTSGPWIWVDGGPTGGHRRAGFTTLSCDARTGILHVRFPWRVAGGLQNIASAWVQHDETMARRGIIAGPSIGAGDMRILFTRITGTGPHPLSCASSLLRGSNANFWIGMLGQPVPS